MTISVLLAGVLAVACVAGAEAPHESHTRVAVDSLEIRMTCMGEAQLTLRDPTGRTAFCGWDSTFSEIPRCRAISMVQIYDAMGDDVDVDMDDEGVSSRDTSSEEVMAPDTLGAAASADSLDGYGVRRFVVLNPQTGEWELGAHGPPGGYVSAYFWLDARVAPRRGAPRIVSCKWAELKPGGSVRSALRVGRDGSVVLVRTVTRGEYVREQ